MLGSKIHKVGQFDRVIEIQSPTVTTSATGTNTTTWAEYWVCRAKYNLKGTASKYEASQEVGQTVRQYDIRYCSEAKGVNATMRIYDRADEEYYYIKGNPEKLKREGLIYITAVNKQ